MTDSINLLIIWIFSFFLFSFLSSLLFSFLMKLWFLSLQCFTSLDCFLFLQPAMFIISYSITTSHELSQKEERMISRWRCNVGSTSRVALNEIKRIDASQWSTFFQLLWVRSPPPTHRLDETLNFPGLWDDYGRFQSARITSVGGGGGGWVREGAASCDCAVVNVVNDWSAPWFFYLFSFGADIFLTKVTVGNDRIIS